MVMVMKLKQYLIALLTGLLLIPILSSLVYAETASNATTTFINTTEGEVITALLRDPKVLFAILIQFLMGFALGYLSVKIIKYVIAFIGIIALGSILSIWSLGGSIEDLLMKFGQYGQQLLPIVKGLIIALGIFTAGPVSAGFIVGLIIGLMRK